MVVALGWGPRGRKFKSCRPDHYFMGELVVELENIKKKFKFNSLAYVLDSEIGEVVVDNEDALITKYFDPQ